MGKKVLIVDDDQGVRECVADYMQAFGYDVEVCSNAEEALHIASKNRFDIVFTDYDLGIGRMDGLAFARHLAEQLADPPYVILMSGHALSGSEIGPTVAAFLPKPFAFAEFKRALPS